MSDAVLRPVSAEDQPFLHRLFCGARPDLAGLPEPLLQMQFRAQAASYAAQFPGAEHQIITVAGRPVGRLLVDRSPERIHLVDIALLAEVQGQGIGTSVLRALQVEADRAGLPLRLSVFETNPARRLYERLGFAVTGAQRPYLFMQWR